MKKKLFLALLIVSALVCLFAVTASATEYTVSSNAEFDAAFASAVDGDTIIIKASINATHDFGKSITYILDGNGITWTAGSQCTATGKSVTILSKGNNTFKPNAGMWCNSYSLTVKDLSSTTWSFGGYDANSTLTFDMDVVDGRLFYGTFCKEINMLSGVKVYNLYSTNSSGDTNYFRCNTMNIFEGVEICGNYAYKPLIEVTTLNMYGGQIHGNVCVGIWSGINAVDFNMYGGSINNNYQPTPHSKNTNASDPQSVAFISASNAYIYDGQIVENYVGYGHESQTIGTAAGIGTRAGNGGFKLYMRNGVVDRNILVTLGAFGTYSLDANGCYICELDSANFENIIDNGDGTYKYERQYMRATPVIYDYSAIFKDTNSSVINAYMVNADGTIVKAYDASTEIIVPADYKWTDAFRYCKEVTPDTTKQGTYYVLGDHTYEDDNNCTTALTCVACGELTVEAQEHDFVVVITYTYGYTSNGVKATVCSHDGCTADNTSVIAEPLFESLGYTKDTTSSAIGIDIIINNDALEEYELYLKSIDSETTVIYGVGVAIADTDDVISNDKFFDENGEIVAGAVALRFDEDNYSKISTKVTGIGEKNRDVALLCSGYLMINKKVIYINGEGEGDNATKVTYNSIQDE